MKPLMRLLLRLYPSAWRQRYGAELGALLEDAGGTWKHLPDILLEALKMRLLSINWRFVGAFALAGIAIATAFSFALQERYGSYAALQAQGDPTFLRSETETLTANIVSRTSLSNLIQSPDLDLYKDQRLKVPLQDVIAKMRSDHLRITNTPSGAIGIYYQGTSPAEARSVVRRLVSRFVDESSQRARARAHASDPPGIGMKLLDPPSLISTPVFPNRPMVIAVGLFSGVLMALACLVVNRTPRAWLLVGLATAAMGGSAYVIPIPYQSETTITFDSVASLKKMTADRHRILADVEAKSIFGVDLLPGDSSRTLMIRTRSRSPVEAQASTQKAISSFIDATGQQRGPLLNRTGPDATGPWIEVLDPPTFPAEPIGRSFREGTMAAGLVLALLSLIILRIERRGASMPPTLEPA